MPTPDLLGVGGGMTLSDLLLAAALATASAGLTLTTLDWFIERRKKS